MKNKIIKTVFGSALVLSMLLTACNGTEEHTEEAEERYNAEQQETDSANSAGADDRLASAEHGHEDNTSPKITRAVVVMHSASGNNITGSLTFTPEGNGVKISGNLKGLPSGKHGFHVHQFGDCSAADFTSAGGHFAPLGSQHGAPGDNDTARHVGDLGNIEAGADGGVTVNITDNMLTLAGQNSILGRAVIIHEKADDFKTQPTGNAGGRIACGVIGIAQNGSDIK